MTASVVPDLAPVLAGRALAHAFEFRCNDPEVGQALGEALAALRADPAPSGSTAYDLLVDDATGRWSLHIDGDRPDPPLRRSLYSVERLMWTINRGAATESTDLVRVHAAVAERDGLAVVLPASMEAGKTTLVTALVRDGFRYLSDELAAIDPTTGQIVAYPKPLGLDPGSWPLFPELAPVSVGGVFDRQWLIHPDRIRSGSVASSGRPALVVTPSYQPGATGRPQALTKVDALRAVLDQTMSFEEAPQRNLETLARLVGSVPCFRLEVDDLRQATSAIHRLLDEA